MVNEQDENHVTMKEYFDARLSDLYSRHARDLETMQAQVDRRVEALSREMNLRFDQTSDRIDKAEEVRDSKFDVLDGHVDRIDETINRQKGRMAAYAVISGIALIALAMVTLVLDHVRL
jgi:hypothetical protein